LCYPKSDRQAAILEDEKGFLKKSGFTQTKYLVSAKAGVFLYKKK
jgi:hypothetical protein